MAMWKDFDLNSTSEYFVRINIHTSIYIFTKTLKLRAIDLLVSVSYELIYWLFFDAHFNKTLMT